SFVSNQDITKADKAIYDLKTNIIELSGNVSIQQGTSNFSGNKLIFNLNTGKGSISGRVKAVLGSDD
ncbi:MAG: lipopolysaccharide transport periplasmic protein LptA, partial [Rhodobacteraceae bacterium]|nr:lipopolysaccharide transport periplasmic protein LptA [Paracoccaceae bacterium]